MQNQTITAKVILDIIKGFGIASITTLDIHSQRVYEMTDMLIENNDILLYSEEVLKKYVNNDSWCFLAPDQGAVQRAEIYASKFDLDCFYAQKERGSDGIINAIHISNSNRKMKKNIILIDDIIDTGSTLISLVKELKVLGIEHIICLATHGIFSYNALDKFTLLYSQGIVNKVIISNSLFQQDVPDCLDIVDINPWVVDKMTI